MGIELISVPSPSYEFKLSHYDETFPAVPVQNIYCFPLAPSQDGKIVTKVLEAAFRLTVQECPILAASVVPFPPEQGGAPHFYRAVIEGSAKFYVNDLSHEIRFTDLQKSGFDQSLLPQDSLCPYDRLLFLQNEPLDACRFQANIVDGGIILVISILHIVCDGNGGYEVTKIFANNCRKVQVGVPNATRENDHELILDRPRTLFGSGRSGTAEIHPGYAFGSPTIMNIDFTVPYRGQTYRISDEARLELHKLASASSNTNMVTNGTNPTHPAFKTTEYDAMQAFLVRSFIRAHQHTGIVSMTNNDPVHQCVFVECRSRLGIPESYLGNAFYSAQSSAPFSTVNDDDPRIGIHALAQANRAQLAALDGAKYRDLLGFLDDPIPSKRLAPGTVIFGHITTDGVAVSSFEKFGFYDLEFGPLGKMEAFRYSDRGYLPGTATLYPHPGKGYTEFSITHRQEVFAELEKDEFFTKYAKATRVI